MGIISDILDAIFFVQTVHDIASPIKETASAITAKELEAQVAGENPIADLAVSCLQDVAVDAVTKLPAAQSQNKSKKEE